MKLILFVLAVTAVVSANEEANVKSSRRSELNLGFISFQDRLLLRRYVTRTSSSTSWSYFFWHQEPFGTRITAIRARESGISQSPTVRVFSGGVGFNTVNIEFRNAPGRGYRYQLEIWGR
uniref:Salivary secreted peptide n=1 Tax=Bombyx mori TaxID=7091 RepID=A0A8R1WGT5_BOMMO|nr:uncharacterized protein LOC101739166 [Bombyx mori]